MPRNFLEIFFWTKETLEASGGGQKPHGGFTNMTPFDLIPLL
jgi:hypothetical protein